MTGVILVSSFCSPDNPSKTIREVERWVRRMYMFLCISTFDEQLIDLCVSAVQSGVHDLREHRVELEGET